MNINTIRKDIRQNKGITLVALVITIIILIILAGIALTMVLGQDGLIAKSKDGARNYEEAARNEQELLGKINELFEGNGSTTGGDSPQNPGGEGGNGGGDTPTEPEVTEGPVAGGSYDTPYIPAGFSHTEGEGTWNNGYTIKGKAGTANANDEFVWVPCVLDATSFPSVANNTNTIKSGDSVTVFGKTTTGKYNSNSYGLLPTDTSVLAEDSTVGAIETSVGTYGGFYIAKYEAGIEGTTENYSLSTKTATDGSVKPLSQQGKGVWNYINRTNALAVSKVMVSTTDGVHSTLISGAAWDTTLQWMVNTSDNATANTGYDIDSANKGWDSNNSGNARHLTGTSVATENANRVNNIWDMAGNVTEWTTENCKNSGTSGLVARGGGCIGSGSDYPAAFRYFIYDGTYDFVGFRVVLYK